jgi:hypothetical protein
MDPINYSIDVQSPFQAALQGYQAGAAIRNDQQAQQQQQQAALQQQQQAKVIQALVSNPNPTAEDYANATLLVPGMKDQFKQAWETRSAQQQQNDLGHISQVYGALQGGDSTVAATLLDQRAQALRNAGNETEAKHAETMAGVVRAHPEFAKTMIGMKLAAIPGGDKVIEGAAKLRGEDRADELQGPAVEKAKAEAKSAATAAKFAESNAALDLEKKGWDIKKVQTDITVAKQNVAIATQQAAIAREANAIRRQELQVQLQGMLDARDEKVRTRTAELESARGSMDNFLNTADRFLAASLGKDGKPSATLRAAAGPLDSRLPTMQGDVADLEALAETMGSQAFLSQIPSMKGMGSLTEREGAKLESSLANLSLKQSPEQLLANVKEAQRLILKARKNAAARYGMPENVPDTPAAAAATPASEVDDLIRKYGGAR